MLIGKKGSGTRILTDYLCRQHDIDPDAVYGYEREEMTHTSVAAQIASGSADAGMGIYSAAKLYGLDFIPVCIEEYDLLIPDSAWDTPMVRQMLATLKSNAFREKLLSLGGYTVENPGEVIPWIKAMTYDAVVIGGGILGCFTARNLMRYNLKAAIAEAADDVCTGITKANSAVVYPGYDNKPDSLKAVMTLRGSLDFPRLCRELEVPLNQSGSIMVAWGEAPLKTLAQKYSQGLRNGVPGLELLTKEQIREREPMLGILAAGGLYAPTAATVNPWQLGIAAWENALFNGCTPLLNTPVLGIERCREGYVLKTDNREIHCRAVLNCAGLNADRVQELLFLPSIRLFPDGADYLVLDAQVPGPGHILQFETARGKGPTVVPTPEGNLMIASPPRPLDTEGTSPEGLNRLHGQLDVLLPGLPHRVIRSFHAVRPNPYRVRPVNGDYIPEDSPIHSFAITNPGPGFYSLIGIKTPGITCAQELGAYLANQAANYLDAAENPDFRPCREAIPRVHDLPLSRRQALAARDPEFGEVVCMCQDITLGEIRQAAARGATTPEGVKRRLGAGMGPCQGSRCTCRIEEILGGSL